MKVKTGNMILLVLLSQLSFAQKSNNANAINSKTKTDSTSGYIYDIGEVPKSDTVPTVNFREINIVYLRNAEEWNKYYTYKSRILTVMPYVKIAKQLYAELQEKQDTSGKRDYRRYRKELEKEMRGRFEKELKDLTTGQAEMLFKLINRETGNNCYKIIKELKGPLPAWFYQMVGKHWGYDLKENYDPGKDKLIELIIKELGPNYKV